jgi:hypothetical protein
MRRPFWSLLLVFALLWQSAAAALPGVASGGTELAHAVLHWAEEAHHHHDDGSYHEDDSPQSMQHAAADASLHSAALVATGWAGLPPLERASPRIDVATVGPPPFIDGPLRPPR